MKLLLMLILGLILAIIVPEILKTIYVLLCIVCYEIRFWYFKNVSWKLLRRKLYKHTQLKRKNNSIRRKQLKVQMATIL